MSSIIEDKARFLTFVRNDRGVCEMTEGTVQLIPSDEPKISSHFHRLQLLCGPYRAWIPKFLGQRLRIVPQDAVFELQSFVA